MYTVVQIMSIPTYVYLLKSMRLYEYQQDDYDDCYDANEKNPEEATDASVGVVFFAAGTVEPGF